jgi:hypothetical protein
LLTKIIERLQTGSISTVFKFGDANNGGGSEYVCLKTEVNPIGRGIRVIAHRNIGESKQLELYIFNELPDLLSNWSYTDEYGNYVTVKDAKEYTDIVADNDDSTISMERLFYIPLIL